MIRHRLLPLLLPMLLLAGCATSGGEGVNAPSRRPARMNEAGLERVMGKTAAQMIALFGPADLDGREGQARRLQFVGPACVLDAYLYPSGTGGEPVVHYVDARLPSGDDIDRASCVAALSRRSAAP